MLTGPSTFPLRVHPVAYVPNLLVLGCGIAMALAAPWLRQLAVRAATAVLGALESAGDDPLHVASLSELAGSATYVMCLAGGGLLAAWMALRMLRRRALAIEVRNDVIEIRHGLLIRRTSQLDLFRVVDLAVVQTPLLTLTGAGNIILWANDHSDPRLVLPGIREVAASVTRLRQAIMLARTRSGAVAIM